MDVRLKRRIYLARYLDLCAIRLVGQDAHCSALVPRLRRGPLPPALRRMHARGSVRALDLSAHAPPTRKSELYRQAGPIQARQALH